MRNKCVVHVCADYPDAFDQHKTPVIKRLVDGLSDVARNLVFSINRVSSPKDEEIRRDGDVWSIKYYSPPLGIMQLFFLKQLSTKIIKLLEEANAHPDVMIGHKFTIESYICWNIRQRLKIPYVAAFMGNTDVKIFKMKPHYRNVYHKIVKGSTSIIFPTPWCADYFSKHLLQQAGIESHRKFIIPYISNISAGKQNNIPVDKFRFITICRLDLWRLKNLHRLIKAIKTLRKDGDDWKLDIVGGGSAKSIAKIQALIKSDGVEDHVTLLGVKSRTEIDELLPAYAGLAMPSYPETFGLVYLEALAVGTPIMVAKDAGIDGYFSKRFPGVTVTYNDMDGIIHGLKFISENNEALRDTIENISVELSQFSEKVIINNYCRLLGLNAQHAC